MTEPVRILHVDDMLDFAEMTATFLERKNDQFSVETARSADEGLAYLAESRVDCVVSDHDMDEHDGIEFLETVREDHPDLPFILFTGKGSEEIASDAISAGVTEYLQKEGGAEQYTVLANRIQIAVEKARAQRERQRHLDAIETVQEGISILDESGHFIYVNRAYADIHDYDPEEMVGKHWEEVYHEEQIPELNDVIFPEVERRGRWSGTTTGLRADGTAFTKSHTIATTVHGEYVCTGRDLTERRARERERERYETIIEALGDPIYALDAEGRYTFVNDAFVAETGYQRSEIIGEHVSRVVSDEDLERGQSVIRGLLWDDDRRATTWELTRVTADGRRVPTENHMALLPDDDGEFRGTAGVLRDITERTERERELQHERDRLDEFASVVSHDLRSPLSVAAGRLELAREECDSGHLDDVDHALDRMGELIADLLTLARQGDRIDETEPVDIATLADRCWQNVETAEATVEAAFDGMVRADRGRLQQLLENLLRNAVDHGGPAVSVIVGDLDDGFYVEDDGPGIPVDERERVFEAGYSTFEEGTGFGLRIVQQIADAHGWDVAVTHGVDGGVRFSITGVEFVNPTE
ncbi:MAG: PAS domain S-box protein [Natronomonas sp.]|jgi:PAS domain S-box-containing protein|uniref:hybrid sensor histidine kinase/response regulator n=1 Tax=Natronomonas sp. TaxID=2184060 RepID=UPI00286FCA78|nr:PAS domain S-box protein [Natronomonas sp.]MDR9430193.1 PAS domain S-box protein [Natronomonas sp.]